MKRARQEYQDHITCEHCRRDFRAITVCHLRNIHGYDGDHPIEDYKRKFQIPSAFCANARKKIKTAKISFWAKRGQHWTHKSLVSEIRRIHADGQDLRSKKITVRLYEAARRLFGSWPKAVETAGLHYEEAAGICHWTPEKVVKAIQNMAKQGLPLHATYVEEHDPSLFNAAVNHFPRSWKKALIAAGIDPDQHKPPRSKWDDGKAGDWVLRRAAKGRSLMAQDAPRDLLWFVHRRLRTTWPEFLDSLGVDYPGIRRRYDWTKESLLQEILRWKKEGHLLNYRAVQSEYQALIHQSRKFFGSWDGACKAAGISLVSRV